MSQLSDMYISVRSLASGKKKLDARVLNPLLRQYRKLLEQFKIEEIESDGQLFKVGVQAVDEFAYELLDEKTLLFSHQLKLNVLEPTHNPYSPNQPQPNYPSNIYAKFRKVLMEIRLENGSKGYYKKIVIETTGIKFSEGERTTGRWPAERLAGIGF